MLTDKDIQIMTKVFATREEVNEKFDELRKDFSKLQTSVDKYAKKADAYFQEMTMLSHKVDRHEKWLHLLAQKLGVKLDY